MTVKISIVVPVYNTEKYLVQCLDSIVNQTFRDIEIICVDDGSTDVSGAICDEYAAQDTRVKVIHRTNGGVVRAREAGVLAAKGEYIAFVDSDDWIEPDTYEKMYEKASGFSCDIVACSMSVDTEDVQVIRRQRFSEGCYDKAALTGCVYPNMISMGEFYNYGISPNLWDKIFRLQYFKEYFASIDKDIVFFEDALCVYPAMLDADRMYVMDECFYHYRQNPASAMHREYDANMVRDMYCKAYKAMNVILGDNIEKYNLRRQWRDLILCVMILRAGFCYRGIERLDYLFPFPDVKRGMNIILYCMGIYGQHLYTFIRSGNICRIAAIADKNYMALRKQGFDVISPEQIGDYSYDAIVVASSFAEVTAKIVESLTDMYPDAKICTMDTELVRSEETMRAFGLV